MAYSICRAFPHDIKTWLPVIFPLFAILTSVQPATASSCIVQELKMKDGTSNTLQVAFPPAGVAPGQFLQLAASNLGDSVVQATIDITDTVSGAVLATVSGQVEPGKGQVLDSPVMMARKNVIVGIVIDVIGAGLLDKKQLISLCSGLELVDAFTQQTLRTYEPTGIVIVGDVITP